MRTNARRSVRAKPCSAATTLRRCGDRIKHRTTYRVAFDNESLLGKCTVALRDAPTIPKTRLQWRKADIAIGQAGVRGNRDRGVGASGSRRNRDRVARPAYRASGPDAAHGVAASIEFLSGVGVSTTSSGIRSSSSRLPRTPSIAASDRRWWTASNIDESEMGPITRRNSLSKKNSPATSRTCSMPRNRVYEKVIYESDTEARFADQLEKNTAIKVYAKLPGWFSVPTPLGSYNPGLGCPYGVRCGRTAVSGCGNESEYAARRPPPNGDRQN